VKRAQLTTAALLSPRYWPTWLLVGLAWLIVRLPLRAALAIGGFLGDQLRKRVSHRRRVAEVNLRLCFPELSAEERERLLRESFRSFGIGIIETGMAWWLPERRIGRLTAGVDGLEYLKNALESGRGVILLTAHFTMSELGARMLNSLVPIHPMYRVHENPVLSRVMLRSFDRHLKSSIERDDVRAMLRCLRNGEAVWYAPDQDYRRNNRVFVPFFGVDAASNPATGRFADMSNALVIPYFPQRLPGSQGYRLTLLPPLEDFPGGDDVEDTARVIRVIEEMVRRRPEQYLWTHRRFRARPDGQPGFYDPP
jgi:Kdo2-lipid IVA lauroyltransferase/acyltransferase